MTCDHSRSEPFSENLRILPNLTSHTRIKNPDAVKHLQIFFKPATFIFPGIGESFVNLKGLYITDDNLKTIKRSAFSHMEQLQMLSLTGNPLKELPEDTFFDLPNIEKIKLNECQLELLPENVFSIAHNLAKLDLSGNKLKSLPKDLFKSNLQLQEVNFISNELQKIETDFTKLPMLKWVNLHLNKCIKSDYSRDSPESSAVKTVQELQDVIVSNCSEL